MAVARIFGRSVVAVALALSVPVAATAATRANSAVPMVASSSAQGPGAVAAIPGKAIPLVPMFLVIGAATAFSVWILTKKSHGHINLPISRG